MIEDIDRKLKKIKDHVEEAANHAERAKIIHFRGVAIMLNGNQSGDC